MDDGVYGSINGQIYDKVIYPLEVPYNSSSTKFPSVLTGPTCCSFDIIKENYMLPELEVGDLIVAKHIGAYAWSTASNFNLIDRTKVIVLDSS